METETNSISTLMIIIVFSVILFAVLFFLYRHRSTNKEDLKKNSHFSPTNEKNRAFARTQPITKSEAFNRIDQKLAHQVDTLYKNKTTSIFAIIDKKMTRTQKKG